METSITMTGESGRTEAVNRMVIQYEKEMLKLCYVYLRDIHLAQEALQESFLKAYTRYHTYRGESSEKTWLNRIAINTCKDLRRSGWFRHMDRTVTPDMIPEKAYPVTEREESITVAVMELPVKLRETALLCWLQGMTCQEAADTLGISHQAVSSRLNRARRKLQSVLERSVGHESA